MLKREKSPGSDCIETRTLILHGTFIRKGIEPVIPDDDMIQDGHIEQQAAILDLLCDFIVGFTSGDSSS